MKKNNHYPAFENMTPKTPQNIGNLLPEEMRTPEECACSLHADNSQGVGVQAFLGAFVHPLLTLVLSNHRHTSLNLA